MPDTSAFKAYDIRGRVGDQLDEAFAFALGFAVAEVLEAEHVVVGRDVRPSSQALSHALMQGIAAFGADVSDLGLCGTEEMYFGTDHLGAGAGIMVTASHNPIGDNGFKMVGPGARPLSDEEFQTIKSATADGSLHTSGKRGKVDGVNLRDAFVERVLTMTDTSELAPMPMVLNAGHGVAGPMVDALLAKLPTGRVERIGFDPDQTFPLGIPNPLIPANRRVTIDAVKSNGAAFGAAWDGDADRCFFFDETGAFIDGEYVVALIAKAMLDAEPGATIVHDPRVVLNTIATVEASGGTAVAAPTGHAFLKAALRKSGAIYGGEMSAHHYFRDFMYCDSGMIPWLLIWSLVSKTQGRLSALVADMRAAFPSSGEINFRVEDAMAIMRAIEARYAPEAKSIDRLDGLSVELPEWRFNLRSSNTEPLLRLNVEARGRADLVAEKVAELSALIGGTSA